ncbi:MAG TPA: hypothetical protein VNV86_01545, partial [Candidatus Acidoferrum sp.]|nr:hypothetical protein [Candidatus Acidoferrum sp.]
MTSGFPGIRSLYSLRREIARYEANPPAAADVEINIARREIFRTGSRSPNRGGASSLSTNS